MQPEVVVINKIAPQVLIKNPCINGIVWNTVLKYEEATSPRRCMRGQGKVHFQKFDPYAYCVRQVEYGLIDTLCMCDTAAAIKDSSIISATPLWYNYQTISSTNVSSGGYSIIEITLDDMEQDFSVPGPYGH